MHFTVLVITPKSIYENDSDFLQTMLAPYQQEAAPEFLEFCSYQDELSSEWNELSEEQRSSYNNDFNEFCEQSGFELDEESGEYGYMSNPNGRWDWWEIGGRWKNLLPCYPSIEDPANGTDQCFRRDLLLSQIEKDIDKKVAEFWEQYQRRESVNRGLEQLSENEARQLDWQVLYVLRQMGAADFSEGKYSNERPITLEELTANKQKLFGFGTYAVLDDEGWHDKDEEYAVGKTNCWDDFVREFLEEGAPDDILTIVDCHC